MNPKRLSITILSFIIVALVLALAIVPASASPAQFDIIHVVQAGETLSDIAVRYGVNMWTIANLNGIANANRIYVGQRLVIPTGPAAPTTGTVHIVQPGNTLIGIGLRYGLDAWTIARANGISNLNHIYVGQRLVIPVAQPAPKPSQPSLPTTYPGPWSAEYFDNPSLAAPPYLTRQDAAVNFNWGWGPPAGGMPTNHFSVRWTATLSLTGGTYRFYTRVDDGVRVYVDGVGVISSWRDGGARTYSSDVTLAAGNHTIVVEYYDRTQVALIYFWYKQLSGPQATPIPTPVPSGEPSAPTTSWFAQFYNGEGLSGDPVATRYDGYIGFDWGTASPMTEIWWDYFSIRWTRTVHLDTATYNFCAMADDGVRLWVGDHLLINEWHGNNGVTYCSPYAVTAGNHVVKVEYFEHEGNALIYVWWDKK